MSNTTIINADAPTTTLRPERVQLRASLASGGELRPERVQLQARLDALVGAPNWAIEPAGAAPSSLTGLFERPADREGVSQLVYGLTEFAPYYGVLPEVTFQGGFVWVTFGGRSGEITLEELSFAQLVQDLLGPADGLVLDGGDSGGDTEEPPADVPAGDVPGDDTGQEPGPAEIA